MRHVHWRIHVLYACANCINFIGCMKIDVPVQLTHVWMKYGYLIKYFENNFILEF